MTGIYQVAVLERDLYPMFDTPTEQMKKAESVTEQLKEGNQMEWVRKINNIQSRAREIVYSNIIYI